MFAVLPPLYCHIPSTLYPIIDNHMITKVLHEWESE